MFAFIRKHAIGFTFGVVVAVAVPALAASTAFHHTNSVTCTAISNTALSTASETVIASDTARKKFCIVNNDASINVFVKFGATAASTDTLLAPGASICEAPESGHVYTGVVDAIAASGTPSVSGFSCE